MMRPTVAWCPIFPQLTPDCSPLHATMGHAISLPYTGQRGTANCFSSHFIASFCLLLSGCEDVHTEEKWRWRPVVKKASGGGVKGVPCWSWWFCIDAECWKVVGPVSCCNLQTRGTQSTQRHLIHNQRKGQDRLRHINTVWLQFTEQTGQESVGENSTFPAQTRHKNISQRLDSYSNIKRNLSAPILESS